MSTNPNQQRPVFECAKCYLPAIPDDCTLCHGCWDAYEAGTLELPNNHLKWCAKCQYEDQLILDKIQGYIDENKRTRVEHIATCNVCEELGVNCCPDLDELAIKGEMLDHEMDETAYFIYAAMYC